MLAGAFWAASTWWGHCRSGAGRRGNVPCLPVTVLTLPALPWPLAASGPLPVAGPPCGHCGQVGPITRTPARYRRQHASPLSANLSPGETWSKPTKPAVQISGADRKRKILITGKCTMTLKKWRDKGKSFRVDRYRCHWQRIAGRCLYQIMSANTKVRKRRPRSSRKRHLSDLKHDLHCGLSDLAPRPRSHRDHHHRLQ